MDRVVAHHGQSRSFLIVDALNAEWHAVADQPLAAVTRWESAHASLSGCTSLHEVLEQVRSDADQVLHALLTEAALGDDLAGRVVLQAMLGKIVRLAWADRQASADDYVSALWCRIRTYPLADRPVRIAANLALDALKTVHRDTRLSPRGIDLAPMAPELLVEQIHELAFARADPGWYDDAPATAATVIAAADQLGLIDEQTRDVLLSVYADGLSGREAADRHRTSPGMIRHRCSKAVRRLALHSVALREAA